MSVNLSDIELRQWLVDYPVTTLGCDPGDIDLDVSLADLVVGSGDSVVLTGELADMPGRAVAPVDLWQHPTIDSLVAYLTAPESEAALSNTTRWGSFLKDVDAWSGTGGALFTHSGTLIWTRPPARGAPVLTSRGRSGIGRRSRPKTWRANSRRGCRRCWPTNWACRHRPSTRICRSPSWGWTR